MKVQKMKETKRPSKTYRNPFIVQAFKGEIDLKTKVEKDRTKYSRKTKHKNKDY